MTERASPQSIRVAAGVLVRDGRMLIGRRRPDDRYGGFWEFPGGKIHADEEPIDALRREFMEELAVTVHDATLVLHTTNYFSDRRTYEVYFFAVVDDGQSPALHAHAALAWVKPGELRGYDLLEGNNEIVARIEGGLLDTLFHT